MLEPYVIRGGVSTMLVLEANVQEVPCPLESPLEAAEKVLFKYCTLEL